MGLIAADCKVNSTVVSSSACVRGRADQGFKYEVRTRNARLAEGGKHNVEAEAAEDNK